MKHQYFGDVNDYLKYGLLRSIAKSGLRLGICWMLTPADGRPDGRKTRYLSYAETWRAHDASLFDLLREAVVTRGDRHLRNIEDRKVMHGARFFGELTPDSRAERGSWFDRMRSALAGSDLVFFDPDNGLEVPSKPVGRKDSSKYVYWAELMDLWKGHKSLLIYQHYPREVRGGYVTRRRDECRSRFPRARIYALSSANVLFLLVVQPAHYGLAESAFKRIEKSWGHRICILPAH